MRKGNIVPEKQLKSFVGANEKSVFLLLNDVADQVSEFPAVRNHKTTLASLMGKSTTNCSIAEYSWCNKKLIKLPNLKSEMDTSEVKADSIENDIRRLMEEGLYYIPESELVRLLRFALSLKSTRKANSSIPSQNSNPDIILNSIFSTSFADAFLVKLMKKLSLEESVAIIEVLLRFLSLQIYVPEEKPSDVQLSKWIFVVYQAHMEALLLSKDNKCMRLLKKLDDCVSEKIKDYEEYETIQNYFVILQQKHCMFPEKITTKYCIESL